MVPVPFRSLALSLMRLTAVALIAVGPAGSGPAAPTHAQDTPPPPRAPRMPDEPAIPMLPGLEPSTSVPSSDLERAQTDGGKFAYQSYADNNWEIYVTNSDYGGNTWRLTYDGSPDLDPAFSPDMSRVVFASRRSGNYDLYRVNADGAGLVMLTNHGATDSGAAWSPDGQRIAFQSNREGNQSDVYVMNADGGGVTRLTTQSGYDGEPAWSPDGTQIAFVSRRSTGNVDYYLYVMNADGSNQHVLAAIPYTGNPSWSWDGKRILVDGLNADGWQRLYLVDALTGQTRSLDYFAGDSNVDVLSGSWGLNDQIYFTRTHYVYYNNVWYWDSMAVYSVAVDWPASVPWLRVGDRMGYPSWSNPDRLPPVSSVLSTATTFQRRSEGGFLEALSIDQGPAGTMWLNMQTRVDGGTWTDHSQNCPGRAPGVFRCFLPNVPIGTLFEYRVRGVDSYLNTEAWPSDPARWGRILYYDTRVTGTVYDQQGRPLAQVPVTGITAHETQIASDAFGRWDAHQIGTDTNVTVTVGSGAAALQRLESAFALNGTTLTGTFYLPPADDVLVNPGFNTGTAGWAASSAAAVTWAGSLSGAQGVLRLSPTGLSGAADVPIEDVGPALTAVVSGTTTIIAYHNPTGLYVALCPLNDDCVSESLRQGAPRDMAVRPDGTVGLIADDLDGTRSFRLRSPAGVWVIDEPYPYMGNGKGHRLLFDSAGRWHAVWAEGDGVVHLAHREDDGSWSGAIQAGAMPAGFDAVIDDDDVIHMIGCASTGVAESTWSPNVGMTVLSPVSNEICDDDGYQGLSRDSAGHIDTVYTTGGLTRFSRRDVGGTWGAPVVAVGRALAADGIAIGPDGRAMTLVANGSGGADLLQVGADGSAWVTLPSGVARLDPVISRSLLAFNAAATRPLALNELPAGLYWANHVALYSLGSPEMMQTQVVQVVALPADVHRPLLSALYRNPLANTDDVVALAVQGAGQAQPTLYPLAAGLSWQRRWFDVSAWAGQTITVSVQLVDGGAPNELTVDLDEVHLGSWTTPVVDSFAPVQLNAPAGSFTIMGDNFFGVPTVTVGGSAATVALIDAQHLTVTLPAGLAYGRHAVLVTNPDGTTTAAPGVLPIGSTQVMLPALLRNAVPSWP